MADTFSKRKLSSDRKSTVARDLVRIQEDLRGTLDETSRLKMTDIDSTALINDEAAEKLRQETVGKYINRYLVEKSKNHPADAYLEKKKKEKITFEFDIDAILNPKKKTEPQKTEESEPKNTENGDLTLDKTLKEKTLPPQGTEADETLFIGIANVKKNQSPQEKEKRASPEKVEAKEEQRSSSGFGQMFSGIGQVFSMFGSSSPNKVEEKPSQEIPVEQQTLLVDQQASLQILPEQQHQRQPTNRSQFSKEPTSETPRVRETSRIQEKRPTDYLFGEEPQKEEPLELIRCDTEDQQQYVPPQMPSKLAIAIIKQTLRNGHFDIAPVHQVPQEEYRENPFADSDIHVDLLEEGMYSNPFREKGKKSWKPKIVVEYYEEKDEAKDGKGNDDVHMNQVNKSSNYPLPVFSNPFDFQNGGTKNPEDPLRFQNEQYPRDRQGYEEDGFAFGGQRGQNPAPAQKKKKRGGEKEVRSGYEPDGSDNLNQSGRIPKIDSNEIKNLKDWMGQRFTDEVPVEQDNQHQKNPRYGSFMKMKGMDSTNSDLDFINRSDKGFDWTLPENVTPLLISRKLEPSAIIEEENEKSTINQRPSNLNTYNPHGGSRHDDHLYDESGKRILNVKNQLPDWYGDPDTDLLENMYLVDAVRYNNFKLIHHPPQSPDRNTMRSKARPSAVDRDRRYDSPPNFSKKLEPSRPAEKADKLVPKVICFVTKYHGGELEDDHDRDEFGDISLSPGDANVKMSHNSPYLEVPHQNAFRSGKNPLKNSNYGLRQPMNNTTEDDGYFDVDKYKQNQQKWAKNNASDVEDEEDEGVRQTVRASVRVSHRRF